MKIRMELLSDTIFGNGESIPGGEDISVVHDKYGFPFFKGTTLKGVFREELERYVSWKKMDDKVVNKLLGQAGEEKQSGKLIFSDLEISRAVRAEVLKEIGNDNPNIVLDVITNLRAFTSLGDNGVAEEGSLRLARCVNSGLVFYGEITTDQKDDELVEEVLGLIKWIGTMRNRGFGKVCITKVG